MKKYLYTSAALILSFTCVTSLHANPKSGSGNSHVSSGKAGASSRPTGSSASAKGQISTQASVNKGTSSTSLSTKNGPQMAKNSGIAGNLNKGPANNLNPQGAKNIGNSGNLNKTLGNKNGPQVAKNTGKPNKGLGNLGNKKGAGNGKKFDPIKTPKSHVNKDYHLKHGQKCDFGYCYHGNQHCHWNHRCYSRHHGCWTYWDPCCSCYYYWCVPDCCFYPVTYCPYRCYTWSNSSFCVETVPVVESPCEDPTQVEVIEECTPVTTQVCTPVVTQTRTVVRSVPVVVHTTPVVVHHHHSTPGYICVR